MPKIHISKYRMIGIYTNLVLLACSLFLVFAMKIDDVQFWGLYGLWVSAILYAVYAIVNHRMITPFSLFFISFCVFQFGQFYLYGFGVDYGYVFEHPFYSKYIDPKEIFIVAKFTLLSIQALMLAGVSVGVREERFQLEENSEDVFHLKRVGKLMFWISLPAAVIITSTQVLLAVRYGYESLRTGTTGSLLQSLGIFNRLMVFYAPSLILLWILSAKKRKTQVIYELLMLVHIVSYLIVGQRTIGLGLAGTLMLLKLNHAKKIKPRTILILVLVTVSLMGLSNYVAEARLANASESFGLQTLMSGVINFVGSCGWSAFPLMVIVGATPNPISFAHGLSYLGSMLSFFPSFIDISGMLKDVLAYVSEDWLTVYAKTTFGIGYSLTAEAYYNFAWYGIIAIFIIGLILAWILNTTKKNLTPFKYYVQMSMTYALFTLPRRGIYDMFNYLFYFVFIYWLLFKMSKMMYGKNKVLE